MMKVRQYISALIKVKGGYTPYLSSLCLITVLLRWKQTLPGLDWPGTIFLPLPPRRYCIAKHHFRGFQNGHLLSPRATAKSRLPSMSWWWWQRIASMKPATFAFFYPLWNISLMMLFRLTLPGASLRYPFYRFTFRILQNYIERRPRGKYPLRRGLRPVRNWIR